jgi:hypothetical protein
MIAVGETAARPADHRRVELVQRLNDAAPNAVDVGGRRAIADPDAIVDTRSKVFNELTVQLRLNGRDGLLDVNRN